MNTAGGPAGIKETCALIMVQGTLQKGIQQKWYVLLLGVFSVMGRT